MSIPRCEDCVYYRPSNTRLAGFARCAHPSYLHYGRPIWYCSILRDGGILDECGVRGRLFEPRTRQHHQSRSFAVLMADVRDFMDGWTGADA